MESRGSDGLQRGRQVHRRQGRRAVEQVRRQRRGPVGDRGRLEAGALERAAGGIRPGPGARGDGGRDHDALERPAAGESPLAERLDRAQRDAGQGSAVAERRGADRGHRGRQLDRRQPRAAPERGVPDRGDGISIYY